MQYWDQTHFAEKITLWLRHIGKISYFHCSRLRQSRRCTDNGPWDTRPCRCNRRDSSVSCLLTPRPRSWLPERRRHRCTATRTNVRAPGNASPLSSPATDEGKTNCIYLERKKKFIYFPINVSLLRFSSWLKTSKKRLVPMHTQISRIFKSHLTK